MCNGWIKLHRKMLDWEWFSEPETAHLFLYFLLSANTEQKRWRGIVIERGQFVTSRAEACAKCGISAQVYRTAMKRLISTNEITSEATNAYTIVTICKYESYQATKAEANQQTNQQTNQRATNEQPTNNQRATTTKNNKNIRREEYKKEELSTIVDSSKKEVRSGELTTIRTPSSVEDEKKEFGMSLVQFIPTYGKEMIREFYDYWTEPTPGGKSYRKKQEKTWDTARRLSRWAKNNRNYGNTQRNLHNAAESTYEERTARFQQHILDMLSTPNEEADHLKEMLLE